MSSLYSTSQGSSGLSMSYIFIHSNLLSSSAEQTQGVGGRGVHQSGEYKVMIYDTNKYMDMLSSIWILTE